MNSCFFHDDTRFVSFAQILECDFSGDVEKLGVVLHSKKKETSLLWT